VAVDVELGRHREGTRRTLHSKGCDPCVAELAQARFSTKTSMTRAGLASAIKSSRRSGNRAAFPGACFLTNSFAFESIHTDAFVLRPNTGFHTAWAACCRQRAV
jgi:hypothetical protein